MFKHGSFRSHPGQVKSTGEKGPKTPPHKEGMKEEGQAPHGDVGEKHVTETHPGETQPHPSTGVHAFHGHHVGGGKYKSYTHHDGGEVETKEHGSAADMHDSMNQALPDEQGEGHDQDSDMRDGAESLADQLGGIGGEGGYGG
jgi:hypothetical protein